jgi:glutamate N-acetyltransferase/amino-acid N-acetyltransferase
MAVRRNSALAQKRAKTTNTKRGKQIRVSPLAPARFPDMPPVAGVRVSSIAAGVRYSGRTDVLLAEFAPGTAVAGVLTRSKTASAPVLWCREQVRKGRARALIVNAGNANAFTGTAGVEAVARTADAVAKTVGCRPSEVFMASTGVIGEPLPYQRITDVLDRLKRSLRGGGWPAAAEAIRTTDTFAKGATRTAMIGSVPVTLCGIVKGSGMIAPDMATMLGFVFTDAKIPAGVLQKALAAANQKTFNAITVDGDTSTSDTVLAFATGQAPRHPRIAALGDPRLSDFRAKLGELMRDLAHQVVRDGEGATKFVSITVSGAASAAAARRIGLSIANSPLVKTAIAGCDPNWGRVVMAVGKAGEAADRDRLSIAFGGYPIAEHGMVRPGYDETPVARYMKGDTIDIAVDVGVGRGRFTVWTCDLTHAYISINADYRS